MDIMVRLTKNVDYGFIILGELALSEKKLLSAKEIASSQKLSPSLVAKILKILSQNGLVNSEQGPKGGYYLAKKPCDITLSEIITIIEGRIGLAECMRNQNSNECLNTSKCNIKHSLTIINNEINSYLEDITLAYLVGQESCCSNLPKRNFNEKLMLNNCNINCE